MGLFQAIGDGANKLVNSATFGLFNRGIGAITGHSDNVDAYNAGVSQRLGRAGDAIEGAATLLPIARAAQGFQQLARLVRPVAAEAAPILGTVARIRAAPVRYAAGGVALGVTSNGRRSLEAEAQAAPAGGGGGGAVALAPAAAAAAAPVVLPVAPRGGRDARGNLSIYSDEGFRYAMQVQQAREAAAAGQAAPTAAAPAAPALTPFQQQLQAFGASSGGLSLNELAALAQAENQSRPAPTRPARTPTGRDVAAAQVISMADQLFAQREAAAQELAATDPAGAQRAYASAVAERMAALQGILGANPINEAVGTRMRAPDDDE